MMGVRPPRRGRVSGIDPVIYRQHKLGVRARRDRQRMRPVDKSSHSAEQLTAFVRLRVAVKPLFVLVVDLSPVSA